MMKTMLRLTAISTLLAAAGTTASAGVLNFDTGLVVAPPGGLDQPTKIDGTKLDGFIFSGGVWAFNKNTPVPGSGAGDDNPGGFLANRNNISDPLGVITVTLDPTKYNGRYFQSVLLQYYSGAQRIEVEAFSGLTSLGFFGQTTPAAGQWIPGDFPAVDPYVEISFEKDPLISALKIDSLKFRAMSNSTTPTFLALDNLDFKLSNATSPPDNKVPEPASFGLVALALLASRAARRRV